MTDSKKQLANAAFKSADEIRQRLFDHRQFTSGEIAYCVREFEEKRQDRESNAMKQSAVAISDMESRLQNIHSGLQSNKLDQMSDRLDALVAKSGEILASTGEYEKRAEQREQGREERRKEMQIQFEDTVAMGKNDLNMDLDQKITQLRQQYAMIEKTFTPSPS